jgi:hypothetical protein
MAGIYSLVVTNASGCSSAAATTTVVVNAIPVATANNNGPVCVGSTLSLTGPAGMTTYSWTGPLGYTSTLQNPAVSASATLGMAGVYSLVVTNASGCSSASATTTVVVNAIPVPVITGPATVCVTSTGNVYSTAAGMTNYTWVVSAGGTITSGGGTGNNTVTVTWTTASAQTVSVNYTNSNSCTAATATVYNVTVNDLPTVAPITGGALTVSVGASTPAFTNATGGGTWTIVPGTGTASITADGVVTGLSAGTVTVTYTVFNTCGSASATQLLTVNVVFGVSFIPGWNWFSVNSQISDMSLGNVLSSVNTNGDYIKNQTSSSTYYSGYGWFGSLTVIDPIKFYKIKVQNSCNINFSGTPSNVSSTSIGLVTGWNWVGYLPQGVLSVNDALSSLSLVNLDYIKNQTKSATYYTGYGWFGSLANLSPSEGYMIKLTDPGTLKYPDTSAKNNTDISEEKTEFLFNPADYEFNGSITATVFKNGVLAGSENDLLFAYVNDEIRGVTASHYFDPRGVYLFPIMVHSNLGEGEIIEFKYYDAGNDQFYPCKETITFTKDMIVSDAFRSFAFNVNTGMEKSMPDITEEVKFKAYPNPFKHFLNVEYNISEPIHVRLTIYDLYGRIIEKLVDEEQKPDHYSIQWDSSLRSGGMYIIKLQTGAKQTIQKIMLTRKNY